MIHESIYELRLAAADAVDISGDGVHVKDAEQVRLHLIDSLARDAVFGAPPVKRFSRWLIWELGQALGSRPASIHEYYMARAAGDWSDRTVPAMNIRFTTYDTVRAALRAALDTDSAAIIFEIARSEMGYTYQEPEEYACMVIAAAVREGYTSPLFIQGDHFQVKASTYRTDPDRALGEVKELIDRAIPAGFWNIDLDTSTLVTLEPESLDEQQRDNYLCSAELTQYVRERSPDGVTISLGGEIGEVGEKNSTVDELDAYMEGYRRALSDLGNYVGLSKVSVQTGTSHGGVLLPDGSQAEVKVDFQTLADLGERARFHGAGGAVQHGASTLPNELFDRFPQVQTLEIHLATGFTNAFLDHERFPDSLLQQINRHLDEHHAGERGSDTDIVFHLKTRKKALGPFKAEAWQLSPGDREAIYRDLQEYFAFFYRKLNAAGSKSLVERIVMPMEHHKPMPRFSRGAGDDKGLAD